MNTQELHERAIYPAVRIKTEKAGGSGIVIYSKPTADTSGEHETFVLTNQHVVDGAISVKEEWDSLLQKNVKRDVLQQVSAELFDYVELSNVISANVHRADIIAYDKNEDMAVIKLDTPKPYAYPATLLANGRDKNAVKMGDPVWACGCSLLHDPFPVAGHISYVKELIEERIYWMDTANQVFGNSGGAVYLDRTGELIGVTARVTVTGALGFSVDIMTWMNFCIPAWRIYEFFEKQELKFLYDDSDTYKAAMKRREKKQEEARWAMKQQEDK